MGSDERERRGSSYFGYGTLLGEAAMRDFCPSARAVAVACYPAHRLEFRQYSDDPGRSGCHCALAPDAELYGVVYALSDADMRDLDEASGVGKGWFRRIAITVIADDGTEIPTTTYELVTPGPEQLPDAVYVGLVRTGARQAGLPDAYVDALIARLDAMEAGNRR